ncbi:MAG: hypothetical protein KIT72_02965 [Polyangiaceae bacterium]|nr:hypothetical protein [Polyangiaceae bacterium]MCW5789361.1 hypothetical protein [Polyangiaceae bacterium]
MAPPGVDHSHVETLVARAALELHRGSVAELINLFEDQRASARPSRAVALAALGRHPARRRAVFIGVTGAPGAGKSTLVGELATRLLGAQPSWRVAVLAVDPSSHLSGGALLGDRTRVRISSDERRFFFRSQASQTALGGLSPASYDVCRLLEGLFDCVFVETVGVGQSEIDIRFLADTVYLVMTPLGGDEIQFLKAGVMEIPDHVVLNKSDAKQAARRAYYALKGSLGLARPEDADKMSVFRTSCVSGEGLAELSEHVASRVAMAGDEGAQPPKLDREAYFFERWAVREWGQRGARYLDRELGGGRQLLARVSGYDAAQQALEAGFVAHLTATRTS